MAELKNYRAVEKFRPEVIDVKKLFVVPDGWNEDIVETAGFIPLEVRFKQMEQAGYKAQFFQSEFTSKDVTDMYLNHPEFDINAEDDIEDALEKMQLRNAYIKSVKEAIRKRNNEAQREGNGESEAEAGKETASVGGSSGKS